MKKKIILPITILIVVVELVLLCSVALSLYPIRHNKHRSKTFKDAFAVVYQKGVPSLLNKKGEMLSLEDYDEIGDEFGEYIIVKQYKNEKLLCGYIDRNGNEIIRPMYDMAYPFSEGYAVVVKDGKSLIINNQNQVVYKFSNDIQAYGKYTNGFLKIEKDQKYSFIDHDFNIGTNYYDSLENFSEGYALYSTDTEDGIKYNFINSNYEDLFTNQLNEFDFVDSYHDGWARVGRYIGDEYFYSFVDTNGNLLVDTNNNSLFETANNFHSGKALIFTGKPYFVLNGTVNYYSIQYLAKDGTYPSYSYIDARSTNKQQYQARMTFSDFVGDYTCVKMNTSGAGYWTLYQSKYDEDEEKLVLEMIKLTTDNKNLTQLVADSYANPYDVAYLKSTPYYENGVDTTLLVSRVFSDSYGIVTMDGQYIFDAVFERVIL